uniref:Nudix (nucleoside diphosphate linked moiety X)-type motif 9 n=1 Tax=Salmo trutta TaxID=8032 RepID=A0A674BZP6_SALTR
MVRVGRNWVGPIQIQTYSQQFPVPDDKVDWKTDWPQYSPVSYTATSVLIKPVWADQDIGSFSPRFNALDGNKSSRPHWFDWERFFNLSLLYVSPPYRWKRDSAGHQVSHPVSKLPILQFVSIKRRDCGEWAIPGPGMVDPEELVSLTLQREFSEEALNSLAASSQDREQIHEHITQLFNSLGLEINNPRKDDNSWMETVAVNFHDDTAISMITLIILQTLINRTLRHSQCKRVLEVAAKERHAHW